MENLMPIQSPPADSPAKLLDVTSVARLLDCSTRHVYRLSNAGRMPAPVKLGSLVRWNQIAIDKWFAEGCPTYRRGCRKRNPRSLKLRPPITTKNNGRRRQPSSVELEPSVTKKGRIPMGERSDSQSYGGGHEPRYKRNKTALRSISCPLQSTRLVGDHQR